MTDTALMRKMDDDLETLLPCEQDQLAACERVIKQGLSTFLDVGKCLAEIRDDRLYKGTHKTFERYCKDRWDLSRPRAYQQICGYEAVALLESKMSTIVDKNDDEQKMSTIVDKNDDELKMAPIGAKNTEDEEATDSDFSDSDDSQPEMILPRNEAQARPLSKLTPDQQVDAWSLVLEWVNDGAKLTSYLVGKAAKQVVNQAGNEALKKERKKSEKPSTLVSRLFQKRMQDLMEVIADEYNSGWRTTSKKEVLSRLSSMIRSVDELV